jgi:hypothetical protein
MGSANDASGGTSHADVWLKKLGLNPPDETIVDGDYGYESRWYRMKDGAKWPSDWWWRMGTNLGPKPRTAPRPRGAKPVLLRSRGNGDGLAR